METENSISEEEVCEIASFKSMNEITGRVIEVTLWNTKDEFGLPVVSIIANNNILQLNKEDIPKLRALLEHIDVK